MISAIWTAEPEESAALLDAIEVARWAPKHRLTQPWRIYLIGPRTAEAVADCWAGYEAELKGEAAGAARRERLKVIPGHFVVTSARDENEVAAIRDEILDRCDRRLAGATAAAHGLFLWEIEYADDDGIE